MTIQEKAKAAIPLLQAIAEGKTLQCQAMNGCWVDCEPNFAFLVWKADDWRVKPEPLEWCLVREANSDGQWSAWRVVDTANGTPVPTDFRQVAFASQIA